MKTYDLKLKVFGQYIGQECRIGRNGIIGTLNGFDGDSLYVTVQGKGDVVFDTKDSVLILKPLSEITDEDAAQVGLWVTGGYKPEENGKAFVSEVDKRKPPTFNFHPLNTLNAFQYLISRGYDLPNFYLGQSTLHECGLAVYESEITKKE